MAKHLKDKTDAECRQLASHYYARARKAEKAHDEMALKLRQADAEIARLTGQLWSFVELAREVTGEEDPHETSMKRLADWLPHPRRAALTQEDA